MTHPLLRIDDPADPADGVTPPAGPGVEAAWLRRFHRGDGDVLSACYREHFATVSRAVGGVLTGADRETAIHDVFYRLVSSPEARASFQGGSLGAWLAVVARRQALDVVRARSREQGAVAAWAQADAADRSAHPAPAEGLERKLEARRLVERFRRERLPPKWAPVFEAVFLEGLSQREAAAALGMSRTTLAYQELRVRHLLRKFFLSPEAP
jgi:RNA polymerase sigma-70 factor (ECF subfamily)